MFTKTISKKTAKNLALLGKSGILKDAYLAGGTALALQIGHRISYDLDFFTEKSFKPQVLLREINQVKSYHHERVGKGTILGWLSDIRFSLLYRCRGRANARNDNSNFLERSERFFQKGTQKD